MSPSSTRHRLTQAALELFLSQGISHTTTRQIANMADVNEATLFRNFGNKYGLLLTMLQEAPAFTAHAPLHGEYSANTLRQYLDQHLQLLEQFPNFVRSLIGEADQYPLEHRQALQKRLEEIQQALANHLGQMLCTAPLPLEELASLVGAVLVGYTVIETTSGYSLWENRDRFLDALVTLLNPPSDAASMDVTMPTPAAPIIIDIPASWVQQLMKQTRSISLQDHAIALTLFGAGLLPTELIQLERSDQICDKSQHILQVTGSYSSPRQVPVNQWILGKRYGSYTSNPLTKWLKSRKDDTSALFITEDGHPMTLTELQERWDMWWDSLDVVDSPRLIQARQTWCVEMLMRGISLENLSILAGADVAELQPYDQRAKEKNAIAAATQLDRKAP
ncbi:TetR family transcriptional regulator [Leptolyngbya cf. ectocarpi LEGE 11479]|uniref:TetR family transcriptional regulator n=1 Tax=Leptolyngbya cf. ectocarpi LEGE 11479 TaxID=1828722 RepID=A0A928WXN7_LEPEC|nr:TetR family transcriptional regulator [Leptolyngbya ectocarpi]MBE9065242.1 TetR family transcriptional regulator [Leptolyngbya cf. ectocarpi LEGE 11479]